MVAHLRREILTGVLKPGDRLLQNSIAERMQTSTTPVREAIRELAASGLVDLDPHHGVMIHRPTEAELQEIYEIRSFLEPMLTLRAMENITEEQLEAITHFLGHMESEQDPGRWLHLNREFHTFIDHVAQRPLAAEIMMNLRMRSSAYVATTLDTSPDHLRTGDAEHRALVEAFRARDPERAVNVAGGHLKSTHHLTVRSGAFDDEDVAELVFDGSVKPRQRR